MMKYKVGDKVRIRKDLVPGDKYGSCYFAREMQKLKGKTICIAKVIKDGYYRSESCPRYQWTDEMLEAVDTKANKRIVIDVDGNKVIARCGDKNGVARCHPDDAFDFYTGAKLALERLEEMEKPYRWLKKGAPYYTPRFGAYDDDDYLWLMYIYRDESIDKMNIKRGIAFKTAEEAIACAKKMLAAVTSGGDKDGRE